MTRITIGWHWNCNERIPQNTNCFQARYGTQRQDAFGRSVDDS